MENRIDINIKVNGREISPAEFQEYFGIANGMLSPIQEGNNFFAKMTLPEWFFPRNPLCDEENYTDEAILASKRISEELIRQNKKVNDFIRTSPKEYVLKHVHPPIVISEEFKETFKRNIGWDEPTFMSKVFVRLKK
jgi:hypothetical protein